MIRGAVSTGLEAALSLRARGPGGADRAVDAVVDTGFNASLALPPVMAADLGLARQPSGGAVLADGTFRQFDIYSAEVAWDGIWRMVLVSAVGDEVLVGMHLLARHELRIAVVAGGAVEIRPLP